jgi:hypothetical protein
MQQEAEGLNVLPVGDRLGLNWPEPFTDEPVVDKLLPISLLSIRIE